jgi:hypothetical protein
MKLYYAPDTCSLSPHMCCANWSLSLNWLKWTTVASVLLTGAIS